MPHPLLHLQVNFKRPHWEGISDEAKDFVKQLLNKVGRAVLSCIAASGVPLALQICTACFQLCNVGLQQSSWELFYAHSNR